MTPGPRGPGVVLRLEAPGRARAAPCPSRAPCPSGAVPGPRTVPEPRRARAAHCARAAHRARAAYRARAAGGSGFCQMFTTRALVRAFLTIGQITGRLSAVYGSSPRPRACFPTRDASRTHHAVTSARLVTSWQEQHASQRASWRFKPTADVDAPRGQRRVERRSVFLYASSCGSIIRQHQEPGHATHVPAALSRDSGR